MAPGEPMTDLQLLVDSERSAGEQQAMRLFQHRNGFRLGQDLRDAVRRQITGRMASFPEDCGLLVQAIADAGPGDHVEIGTQYGATAILAAMAHQQLGIPGDVWAIDPLAGYYQPGNPDPYDGPPQSPEIFWHNAKQLGVADRVHLIQAVSDPWPAELADHVFATAFVDGWHWGEGPARDLRNLRQRVTRYIVADNYDRNHPAVVRAVTDAIGLGSPWVLVHLESITAVLERDPDICDVDPQAERQGYRR
jgi:hypothetical protein